MNKIEKKKQKEKKNQILLVQSLYIPNQSSDVILKLQQQLQSIQKQPDATILAHGLLQYNDQNVQFFGALTYTVYLSTHVIDSTFADLMVNEVVNACSRSLNLLVIKKLLSNIGKIYVKILYSPVDMMLKKLSSIGNIDQQTILKLGLLSCKIIAEELNRSDELNKDKHEIILSSMLDKTTKNILNSSISIISQDSNIKSLWLECLQSWVFYVSKAEFDSSIVSDLNDYFNIAIELLVSNNDIESLNLILDIYDTNPSLLNNENKNKLDVLIFSDWSSKFIELNDIDDNSKLSRLITLYLDSNMLKLASKMIDPNFDHKFQYLLYLTDKQGEPIIDETFSIDLLEFWILFAESFVNDTDCIHLALKNDQDKISLLNEKANVFFLNLSQIYWKKCHLIDDLKEAEDEIYAFRRDIGELFESLFAISRYQIFDNLITSIINNLRNESVIPNIEKVKDIEASLYLLTSISSIFTENTLTQPIVAGLKTLFDSNFLTSISKIDSSSNNINTAIYQYLIRITINFLSEIHQFYLDPLGEPYIGNVLIFLFQQLNNNLFQESSSKAILLITDTCRDKLSNLLDDFEVAANSMIVNKFDAEIRVRSRIIRSYASILQTIKILDLQAEKISNFLELIYNESISAYQSIELNKNNPDILENIDNFLNSMVSSLVGLSKGLQIPEDWEDYFEGNEELMIAICLYWKNEDFQKFQVHDKCLRLIFLYSFPNEVLPNLTIFKNLEPKMLEQVCLFFKSGLSEPLPGPFVIEYDLIVDYIIKCCKLSQITDFTNKIDPPMINIIELYGMVIKSNHTSITISKLVNLKLYVEDLRMNQVIDEILFRQFDKIVNEPDIMQAVFTLFADIISRYPTDLINNERIFEILQLGVLQLSEKSQERFLVMSLSKMWTNIIYLRKGKIEDVEYLQKILIEDGLGNLLVHSVMKGFMNTSRSNIEFYSDIMRALTAKYGKYLKKWIVESFTRINMENSLNNAKIIAEDTVRKFSEKLLVTRGNRVANRIIQEFWFSITGMVDYGM